MRENDDDHREPHEGPSNSLRPSEQASTDAPGASRPKRLLVVDDSEVFRERLARAFRERGFEVETAANHAEAVESARKRPPQMAVIDLRMPGPSGLELLRDLRTLDDAIQVVVLTGFGSISTAIDAMRLGACNYLSKPADADEILAAFQRAQTQDMEPRNQRHEVPSLARAEWEHIHRVLSDCGGNISEAARRLGIHRRSLQRKLRRPAPDS